MAGRGKKYEFTKVQLKKIKDYARLNCNTNTIAEIIGVSDDTMQSRPDIQAILRKNRALHRLDVRKGQSEVAKDKKNPKGRGTMLIWQGKNDLGQTDKRETELTGAALSIILSGAIKDDGNGD